MKRETIDVETLRSLFLCNAETGELFWKSRPPEAFTCSGQLSRETCSRTWNTKNAGKRALNTTSSDGYCRGEVAGRYLLAHRVIWAMIYGEWPSQPIDHINGNPADNRISNLRSVSLSENQRNRRISKNNQSGVCGVSWRPTRKKWGAVIRAGGKQIHLGSFDLKADAIAARKAAEIEHGYHQNHGRQP